MHEPTSPPGKPVWMLLGLGLLLGVNAFVLVPLTLYLGNVGEFAAPLPRVLVHLAVPTIAVVVLAFVPGVLLGPRGYRRWCTLIAAGTVLVWLQGYLLVWDYGLLDGRTIDWSVRAWRGWLDTAVWLAVLGAALAFSRALLAPLAIAAVGLTVLQFGTVALEVYRNVDSLAAKAGVRASQRALEAMPRFSPGRNVLHLLLDGFQSDVFAEIVFEPVDGPRYREALDGFVYFHNHLGVFPTTYMTVPALLSTKVYTNQMPRSEFVAKAIGGPTFLSAAHDAGYEVDLASIPFLVGMYGHAPHENAYAIPRGYHLTESRSTVDDVVRLVDLALFRIVPHYAKRLIYDDQRWLVQSIVAVSGMPREEFFSHTAFLLDIAKRARADRAAPVYKYLHVTSSHWPMVVDDRCNYAGRVFSEGRSPVVWQSRCVLESVVRLLDKMKELGIYDDALIILMADHGAGIPPPGLIEGVSEGSTGKVVVNPKLVAYGTPLMAIKLPGASGTLRVSGAPTSILDLPATVVDALGIEGHFEGRPMFGIDPDEARERRMYHYVWSRADWTNEYAGEITEMVVDGDVYDARRWRLERKIPNPR